MIFLCLSPTRLDNLERDSSFHKNLIFPINFFKGKQLLSRRCIQCVHTCVLYLQDIVIEGRCFFGDRRRLSRRTVPSRTLSRGIRRSVSAAVLVREY